MLPTIAETPQMNPLVLGATQPMLMSDGNTVLCLYVQVSILLILLDEFVTTPLCISH